MHRSDRRHCLGCFSSDSDGRPVTRGRPAGGLPLQGGPSARQRETRFIPRRCASPPAIASRQLDHEDLSPIGSPRSSAERSGCPSPDLPAPCLPVSAIRDLALFLALALWTTVFERTKPPDRIALRAVEDRDCLQAGATWAISHAWRGGDERGAQSPIRIVREGLWDKGWAHLRWVSISQNCRTRASARSRPRGRRLRLRPRLL